MQDEEIFRHVWGDDAREAMLVSNRYKTDGFVQTRKQQVERVLKIISDKDFLPLLRKNQARKSAPLG